MRVLLVNTFYFPNMKGGAEQSTLLLAEGLVNRGHDVSVFTIDSSNELYYEIINGVTVYRAASHPFKLNGVSSSNSVFQFIKKARQKICYYYNKNIERQFNYVLDKVKPDIVHTNSMNGMPSTLWKTCDSHGVPIVHTVRDRGPVSPYSYGRKENSFIRLIHNIYMRYYSSYVDALASPSQYTLDTTLATGCFSKCLSTVKIFNSVNIDVDKLNELIDDRIKRTGPVRFMFAGRLIACKGVEHMLRAFASLEGDCELVVCGEGNLDALVHQYSRVDNRIKYSGMLDAAGLEKMYESCDVLVVPSFWPEPFGRVVIEANAKGMPVIASNMGGIPEILKITNCGVEYTAGDSVELCSKLRMLMKRENINKLVKNLSGMEEFDLQFQLDRYESLYEKVVG